MVVSYGMSFDAMYYPYTCLQNVETLKQSLLIFDKIYVLSPYDISTEIKRKEIIKVIDEISEYGSDILISNIRPSQIIRDYEKEFNASIKEDLKDEYFQQIKDEKLLLYNPKLSDAIWKEYPKKIHEQTFDKVNVDGDLAESILINHTIFACIHQNLTPFTDESFHHKTLIHKLEKNYGKFKGFLFENGYISDLNQAFLTKSVIEAKLPCFTGVEIPDLLNFRDSNKRELKSFRVKMGQLSANIKSSPFTLDFEKEIKDIIKSEIDPAIQEINNSLLEYRDDMIIKYGKKLIPITLSVGGMVNYGVPLEFSLIAGTIVDKLGGKSIFEDILTDIITWKKKYKLNSYHYLFKMKSLVK